MAMNGGDPTTPPCYPPRPVIGKIGPYTVFVTPQTPKPSSPNSLTQSPLSTSPPPPPPVLPPPVHYSSDSHSSPFRFFWDAIAKVQNAHSSLDGYVAHWFGLNQSKYQWALDDYYETKELDHVEAKAKDMPSKAQSV